MGLWRRVVDAFRTPIAATFSESAPRPIDQVIWEMSGRGTSRVTREQALTVPTVLKGRNLICSISTLPLVLRRADNTVIRSALLEQIDPDVPNVVTLAMTLEDLQFEGIAWWEITARDPNNFPISARHLDTAMVSIEPPADGRSLNPLPAGYDPRGATVWIDGTEVPASQVIRFDSPNPAVLVAAARAIRRAILLDKAAGMYADDPRPLDYFTPTEGADDIDDADMLKILADWKAARKKRSTAWVPKSMKYNSVDAPSPAELQLVELQTRAGLDIANAIGIDPEELGISTTSRTYANVIDRRRDKINDVLSPYMLAITQRLSMGDVTRRGHRVKFDLADYLKSNPTEQASVHKSYKDMGVLLPQEIREEIGRPPLPTQAAPAPDVVAEAERIAREAARDAEPMPEDDVMRNSRTALQFTATAIADPRGLTGVRRLELDGIAVDFRVEKESRTIWGLAIPYGKVVEKWGLKFRFMPGSVEWTTPVSRVKFLIDHMQAVGYALGLTQTRAGVLGKYKLGRSKAADDALMDAEDGVYDGLSVGVDFDLDEDAILAQDGVWDIYRARMNETSLTAMPAFDDARITKVVAKQEKGTAMEDCAVCGQRHAPGMACASRPQASDPAPATATAGLSLSPDQLSTLLSQPGAIQALVAAQQPAPAAPATPPGALTLSAEQVTALINSGGLGTLLGVPQLTPAPQPAGEERPTAVDPTRRKVTASTNVREELPYRFDRDGNLTKGVKYDFSTDVISGAAGDGEAMQRASLFLKSQRSLFDQAQFDTDTTDVAALNPNRNRPDMYVDQRDFTYPIWDAISKGTLADQVPFVLPKFATATGLVAAHVEAVEPTAGTFTASSQTITPSANSGKVEITREAWDAGGNPQLSGIIWRQMVKAWFESLEASAVVMLDALTPTQITLSTAAADDVLVGELEAAMASLQFIRGGFSMRDFFLQIDLYKALAAAVDADGRKLLPMLGAVNANGTVSELFADLNIGGLRGRPAWALAASGSVAASSYLFDRASVHGWASAPQRLQFEYRVSHVDVAIWGYKALATTDVTGVREVVYDPI